MITNIFASTISDAWFQCLYNIFDPERTYKQTIQRGSYVGQYRIQYCGVSIFIKHPAEDIVPTMPPHIACPPPVDMDYVERYFQTLLKADLQPNEVYTYGERICVSINDIISMLRDTPETNQAIIQVGQPTDVELDDPPCLRHMDLKVWPGENRPQLTMSVVFRSWDLWSGLPGNLGGFELLKQYIASEVGIDNGPLIAYSAGLHLYEMYIDVAEMRTGRKRYV